MVGRVGAPEPDELEPAGRAGVGRQRRERPRRLDPELGGNRQGRQRVEDRVPAGHGQRQGADGLAGPQHLRPRRVVAGRRRGLHGPPAPPRAEAVVEHGHRRAGRDARTGGVRIGRVRRPDVPGPTELGEDRCHARIVAADDQPPAGAHPPGEGGEHGLDGGLVREHIGVLPLDVGDYGDGGLEPGERAAVLVRLEHEHVPGADQRVAAELGDLRADHGRGVQPGRAQHQREHRRRRRLAVRAGDRDQTVPGGQLGQPLGAAAHRQAEGAGGEDLGMVVGQRAGRHDDIHPGELRRERRLARGGADADRHAAGPQGGHPRGVLGVAAADRSAAGKVDLGQGRQAGAADPEEVDVLGALTGHGGSTPFPVAVPAVRLDRVWRPGVERATRGCPAPGWAGPTGAGRRVAAPLWSPGLAGRVDWPEGELGHEAG
ncbi:hypothetical protein FAGKG844_170084 [Frankia sp. AgKG'84/4]